MARACGSYPQCQGFKSLLRYHNGVSPSGKATDSDSVIRRFESCYPSFESPKRLSFFMLLCSFLQAQIKTGGNKQRNEINDGLHPHTAIER